MQLQGSGWKPVGPGGVVPSGGAVPGRPAPDEAPRLSDLVRLVPAGYHPPAPEPPRPSDLLKLVPGGPPSPAARRPSLGATSAPPSLAKSSPQTAVPAGPPAAPPDAPEESVPAKKSLGRRLLKVAGYAGMAVSAAAGVIGGIAVQGNYEALKQAPSMSLTLEGPGPRAARPSPFASTPVTGERPVSLDQVRVPADGVSILLPGPTLTNFARDFRQDPAVRRALDHSLAEVKANLEKSVGRLPATQGQVLVDLEVPLPTGERAFLHVGEVDLPSLGLRQLHTEKVPLAVTYDVQPGEARLRMDLQPVEEANPARPQGLKDGVYVGSLRVRVDLPEEGLPLQGQVRLMLDMDGRGTTAELQSLQNRLKQVKPGSEEARRLQEGLRRLQWRSEQAQRLKLLGSQSNLDYNSYLEKAFADQRLELDARVHTGGQPLVETRVDLWLGPDVTRDGKADLHVATTTDYSTLDRLQVEARRVESVGQRPDGRLAGHLHDEVRSFFRLAAGDLVPKLSGVVQDAATKELSATLRRNLPMAQQFANQDLARMYRAGGDIEVNMPDRFQDARLRLTQVQAVGQGDEASMLIHYRMGPASRQTVPLKAPRGMVVREGEMLVRLGAEDLARQVGDVSQGGSVHWRKFLDEARDKAGLRKVEFGKNAQGRTVYPRLVTENGKLALNFDLVLEPDVVGLVRPTIHRGVVIPLEVKATQGKLLLRPVADGVHFTETRTEGPGFEAMDLLPTRWIGSIVGNIVADSDGPAQISQALKDAGYPLDLRGIGLEVREVGLVNRGGAVPDLVARLAFTKDAPAAVVRQVGGM